jgi:hypothetical protein
VYDARRLPKSNPPRSQIVFMLTGLPKVFGIQSKKRTSLADIEQS